LATIDISVAATIAITAITHITPDILGITLSPRYIYIYLQIFISKQTRTIAADRFCKMLRFFKDAHSTKIKYLLNVYK